MRWSPAVLQDKALNDSIAFRQIHTHSALIGWTTTSYAGIEGADESTIDIYLLLSKGVLKCANRNADALPFT